MKFKYEFEIVEMEDSFIAVPIGDNADEFHGVLKVNESAKYILECLREDTTEDAIIEKILAEFEGERTEIASFVHDYIGELKAAELLA